MRVSRVIVTGTIVLVLVFLLLSSGQAQEGDQLPVGGAFTFQGFLSAAGSPIDDTCDFHFGLWDAATGGTQVGPALDQGGVAVQQGRFTVQLDFGDVFDGTALWLETAVRCTGEPDYTTLVPRQALTAAPYALGSPWTGLYGVPAGFADDVDNDVLGDMSCANGQVAKWDGAAWSCAVDEGNAYSAGAGLVLTGTVFAADTTFLQRRAAPCGPGYAIQEINEDGTVVCALVDNTTYDAGPGLILSGTTFLADPAVVQLRITATCGDGSSIRQVNEDGTVVCEVDDDTLYQAGLGMLLTGTTFLPDTTYLQRRVAPCGVDYAIQQVNQDGSVVCQPVDNTTYSAGNQLTLTGTTFDVVEGAGSDLDADMLDGLQSSDYQRRVIATCGAGSSIRVINPDGTVVCEVDDDTIYSAGVGLSLTGTTFVLLAPYRLPQACPDGYTAEWNSTLGQWECAPDDNTTYSAGNQLTLTGTTFDVVEGTGSGLDADLLDGLQSSAYQLRVSGVCTDGFSIREINADGTVVCEPDDDTTYDAGTGLLLTGTTFFPDPTYLQRRVAPCGASYAIQRVNQDGSVVCQVVDNTTYDAGTGLYLAGTTFGITTTYRLPQSCSGTQVAKWNGTAWLCADDNDTTYDAGAGLNLAGTTFSLLAAYRLPQSCPDGYTAKWNNTLGQWECAADDNTTYSPGVGLSLSGTTFDITPPYRLPQSCGSTQIARWDGAAWTCSSDVGVTDHGALSGLGDDDHQQYFALAQNETVSGIPAFNGGVSGSTAPFTVDSTYLVAGLNADLLDGYTTGSAAGNIPVNNGALNATLNADRLDNLHAVDFAGASHTHWGQSWSGSGTGLSLSGGTTGLYGSGTTYGLWGSSSNTAVYGIGGTFGVYGSGTYGTYGTGTYGAFGNGSSYGVWGNSSNIAVYATGGSYGVIGSGSSTAVYGSGGTYGLYGSGTYGAYGIGSTYGVWGNSSNTAVYAQGGSMGVYASGTNTGVYGTSSGPAGVYGYSSYTYGYGVYGESSGTTAAAVYGREVASGYPNTYGVAGHHYWNGVGVGAWSYSGDIMRGYSGDYPGGALRFYVSNAGVVWADSGFNVFSVFPSPDGKEEVRTLYTPQSPEPWSEDAGTAQLVDGRATVTIEPLFAQTVDLAADYHVFVTPLSETPVYLYVTAKDGKSFTVAGVTLDGKPASCAFDYRILAKPEGTAGQRMEVLGVDPGARAEKVEEQPEVPNTGAPAVNREELP